MAIYTGSIALTENDRNEQLPFMLAIYLLTDLGPRYAPKCITFSEAFTLATLVTVYTSFTLKQMIAPVMSSVGNPTLNAIVFAPWISIICLLAVFLVLRHLLSPCLKPSTIFNVLLLITLVSLACFYLQDVIFKRLLKILLHQENVYMIAYLAITLSVGLFILYDLSKHWEKQVLELGPITTLTHRKLFHVLALVLYTPMHIRIMEDRKMYEFLMLSQNLVTVLFIFIELTRFINLENQLGKTLNIAFMRFVDHRERTKNRLLLTHVYLLIGLGVSTNLNFILLNGGFPDGEMAAFSYSGVIFLGVADVFAAIIGSKVGSEFWRAHAHKKTYDGTLYALLLTSIAYYIFCMNLYPHMCSLFLIVFFATFCTCIVEGWTSQFDNLVCPVVFWICLHQLYDYAMNIA